VEPEIAIVALQVTLEKEELGLNAIHQRAKIDEDRQAAERLLRLLQGLCGTARYRCFSYPIDY
jgi:hypothetical protein